MFNMLYSSWCIRDIEFELVHACCCIRLLYKMHDITTACAEYTYVQLVKWHTILNETDIAFTYVDSNATNIHSPALKQPIPHGMRVGRIEHTHLAFAGAAYTYNKFIRMR